MKGPSKSVKKSLDKIGSTISKLKNAVHGGTPNETGSDANSEDGMRINFAAVIPMNGNGGADPAAGDAEPEKIIYALTPEEMREEMMARDFIRFKEWFRRNEERDNSKKNRREDKSQSSGSRSVCGYDIKPTPGQVYEMRRRKENCFFCTWGNLTHDSIDSNKVKALFRLFDDIYGQVDDEVLSSLIKMFYDQEIYAPMREREKRIPVVEEVDVMMHVRHHMKDPRVFIRNKIEEVSSLTTTLANKIMSSVRHQNEDLSLKNTVIDLRLMKAYEMMLKLGISLYNKDTSKMLFRSPHDIDLSQKKCIVNLLKSFKTTDG